MTVTEESDGTSLADASLKNGKARTKGAYLVPALAAALAFLSAGGAAFFMIPERWTSFSAFRATERASEHEAPSGAHSLGAKSPPSNSKGAKRSEKKSHGEEKNAPSSEGQSQFFIRGDVGVFIPRPIVVTLKPQGRVRYLKIGIAIETSTDADEQFFDGEFRMIDALNTYLRSVPIRAIEDPAAMARIREQIARRVRFAIDKAPVHAVLITDFILS